MVSEQADAAPGRIGVLVDRVRVLAKSRERVIVGIVGAPGAGKSMLTDELSDVLRGEGLTCEVVPMDGFHLAQAELERLGRAARKGAIDTFDADGYVALLRRLRTQRRGDPAMYAPRYVRGTVEESIGSAISVPSDTRVVLTEGNYLLAEPAPWWEVREIADETWYLDADDAARRDRLLARHLANGKTYQRALAFTDGSDARNAELIEHTAPRADVVVRWRSAD